MAQKIHSSIRLSESEKSLLDSTGGSILEATRIGLQVLSMALQSGKTCPLYYIHRKAESGTHSAAPCLKASTPPSACCPACPIKNGLAKRYLAAHCHGIDDPAFNPAPLIDVQDLDPSSIITVRDLVVVQHQDPGQPAADVSLVSHDIDELFEEVRRIVPAAVINARGKCIPIAIEGSTPDRDREIMARLKKERASS